MLVTTAHRHPVHAEFGDDKTRYWYEIRATDGAFYSTVTGFLGHSPTNGQGSTKNSTAVSQGSGATVVF
ncbi:unannotated protein [freshwater metagenome]|uniref:Unannotated protein n=1 Tax=freshwater metagenome TaxID=449393 RepID=A0A6J7AM24_9ZZZZ